MMDRIRYKVLAFSGHRAPLSKGEAFTKPLVQGQSQQSQLLHPANDRSTYYFECMIATYLNPISLALFSQSCKDHKESSIEFAKENLTELKS